jgi:5'-deoxynucleotidase YfbR-like HD superfamily hydrolase
VAMLCTIVYHEIGDSIDYNKLMHMALCHDIEECITSDIPYFVNKHVKDGLKDFLVKSMDSDDPVHSLKDAPDWLKSCIIAAPDEDSMEHKIMKMCDLVELAMYCVEEVTMGNKSVLPMLNNCIRIVELMNRDVESSTVNRLLVNFKQVLSGKWYPVL